MQPNAIDTLVGVAFHAHHPALRAVLQGARRKEVPGTLGKIPSDRDPGLEKEMPGPSDRRIRQTIPDLRPSARHTQRAPAIPNRIFGKQFGHPGSHCGYVGGVGSPTRKMRMARIHAGCVLRLEALDRQRTLRHIQAGFQTGDSLFERWHAGFF